MLSAGRISSSIESVDGLWRVLGIAEGTATSVVGFGGMLLTAPGIGESIILREVFEEGWSEYGSSSSGMILVGGVAGIPFGGTV